MHKNNLIVLKKATLADLPLIRNMAMATWPVTYSPIISASQIEYMLHLMYSEKVLQQQMESGEQEFMIAYQNETPIAFTGFGIVSKEPLIYKLHKLYVLPNNQKSGAGKQLLLEVILKAKAAGATQLILNVNRANNAKGFYKKMGFAILEEVNLDIGKGFFMTDYIMGLDL